MAALSAPRRRAGGREYVLAPKLDCTLVCGENARASGLLGRIQAVRPYDALSDAEKRDVMGPRGDEMVRLQVYEQCSASRDGVARLDLTTRRRWVAASAIESTILVVHEEHTRDGTVPLPLGGVADAYVIGRSGRSPVTAKQWKSIPGQRTGDDLDWRLELRRTIYGLLSGDVHVVDVSAVGYSAAKLLCSETDWALIRRMFLNSAAAGAPPRITNSRGERFRWSLQPGEVQFVRSGNSTQTTVLEFASADQLTRVGACLGQLWNAGVSRRVLDGQRRREIGLEDPARAEDPHECVSWTLHAVTAAAGTLRLADESDSDSEDETPVEAPAPAPDDCMEGTERKRPRASDPKKPSAAVLAWEGKFFDDSGEVWQVDDIRFDEMQQQWVVMTVRIQPPPPKGRAARDADDTWYNWAEIKRFRASFASALRKRETKHARAARVPGLRLRYVRSARGRGTLTVGAFWRAAPAHELGGRTLSLL